MSFNCNNHSYKCASILLESLLFLFEFTVGGAVHVASLGHHRSGSPVEVLFESRPIIFFLMQTE